MQQNIYRTNPGNLVPWGRKERKDILTSILLPLLWAAEPLWESKIVLLLDQLHSPNPGCQAQGCGVEQWEWSDDSVQRKGRCLHFLNRCPVFPLKFHLCSIA